MNHNQFHTTHPSGQQDTPLHIHDFRQGFLKFWWIGAVLGILFSAVAFCHSRANDVPRYRATATYAVHLVTGSGTAPAASGTLSAVFPYVMDSPILHKYICADLGIQTMAAELAVECIPDTNMITVTATGTDSGLTLATLSSAAVQYTRMADYILGPTQLLPITEPLLSPRPINSLDWLWKTASALLVGLGIGAGWIIFYALVRRTIHTPEDIHRELNQVCIGSLPLSGGCSADWHLLCSRLNHRLASNDRVILLTATAPGEGTTTVASHLASAFASQGRRVLLVEGDIRRSKATQQLPEGYEILSGDGADILRFSAPIRNRRQFLQTNRLEPLFAQLRQQYDLIFIDTPPWGIFSDAMIFACAADGILYIVRQDMVLTDRIRLAISSLSQGTAPFLGCVLTAVGPGHDRSASQRTTTKQRS